MTGLLACFLGGLQLLLQAPGILLQVEQGALALFILGDALGQLAQLLIKPGAAFGCVLIEQRGSQWVRVQARLEGLLLRHQVLLLLQVFLLLGDQATHFAAKLGEFFLEGVHDFLRRGFFVFVMATEALQQGFGLVIRVFMAAADWAGLVILQLLA